MAKQITIRFFKVGKMSANGMSFRDALDKIYKKGTPGQREMQLGQGFRCRLERLSLEAGFVSGEMTRIRDTDFPSEVKPTGTNKLPVGGPIGDGIAFRFRESDHTLAIQYDPRVLSPGRMFDYIGQMLGTPLFTAIAKIDNDAFARFKSQPLRKVQIKLASPQHLGQVENSMQAAASAFKELGQDYDAPVITLEMSMGRNNGQLANGAKDMVEGFLKMVGVGNGNADVRAIRVKSDPGVGVDNEDINLLDQILSDQQEIPLPVNDPDGIYNACSSHIKNVLNNHA